MIYGYARVSTEAQSLDLQLDALKNVSCDKIYSEKVSGGKKERPELGKLLKKIKGGDSLYCYKLDRLGRSLKDLVQFMTLFEEKKVRFVSLADGIDTATSGSKLLLNILMCIADFERELIRSRTIAGLEAAKNRGVKLGRPIGIGQSGERKRDEVLKLSSQGETIKQIMKKVKISKPTVYKYLASNDKRY